MIAEQIEERIEKSDKDWDILLQAAKNNGKHLKAAEQKRKGIDAVEIQKLRFLCKTNTYFLAKTVLNYDRLRQVHYDLCKWLDDTDEDRFRLNLMPRGHFKSTLATITKSIQVTLPFDFINFDYDILSINDTKLTNEDKDNIRNALIASKYPSDQGPNARVLIGHETAGMAQTFLYEITNHYTGNELLMALFPEAIPDMRVQRMNKQELELPRNKPWKEATFSTMGVGGKSQGYHFNYLFLDDLIGEKARDSETEMQTAKLWIDNIQAFFSHFGKDKILLSGTRYANDDLYSHIMGRDRYGDELKVYHRAVEELNVKTGKMEAVFPEEFNEKVLRIIRKNKKIFNAQYMNDPDAGATTFDEQWIRYFEWQNDSLITVFRLDPLTGKKKARLVKIRDLFIALLWDPALNGDSGWNITGTDSTKTTYVLESFEGEISAPEAIEKIFELHRKYQFNVLAIEEVLFSELYRHWLMREFQIRGVQFHIHPVSTKQKAKEARVQGLSTNLSAGELYFNEKYYTKGNRDQLGNRSDLIYELIKFGSIKEYHSLDALAYGPEIWRPGFDRGKLADLKKQEHDRLKNTRSAEGYSTIKYRAG